MFRQVLIIGVGLLGSSLALALKKHKLARKIVGCGRSQDTLRQALKMEIIEGGNTDPTGFAKESDLVVFCLPLCSYGDWADKISAHLKHDAILTDVGSVKKCVVDDVFSHFSAKQRSLFVPGHPIAGSENSGPEAGFAELFEGKQVILTPVEQTNKSICNKIEEMWTAIGARVSYMTPEKHDEIFAHVSHAVQFLAYSYRLAFSEQTQNEHKHFKRFLRIAHSDPKIWLDIFKCNKQNILQSVNKFRDAFLANVELVDENDPLPALVARASNIMAEEYKVYAGQGFVDFISPLSNDVECDQNIGDAPNFLATLDTMIDALEKDNIASYLPNKSS